MSALLRLSALIDLVNERVGKSVIWLVLLAVLISAGNASVRKAFDLSSNAWLEVQWYLFAAIFLLGAGYTLLHNEHVRIDVLMQRLSKRNQMLIDIFGLLFFLLPFAILMIHEAWPLFAAAWRSGEMSENAGGLIRWPAYLLVPAGFGLLALQGVSEVIKRIAFLNGLAPDPTRKTQPKSAEKDLAASLAHSASVHSGEGRP